MKAGDGFRVLHVIPAVAARYGGPSRAVVEMSRALLERGIDVLVATTDADGARRLPVAVGRTVDRDGVPMLFYPRLGGEGLKYSPGLARWLRAHVGDFDVAHVHAVFSHACLAAAAACRRSGVPYVVRPLGTLHPWSLAQKPIRKRLLWHLAARRMLHSASAVHYTSSSERRAVEGTLGLSRGVVIPLGVEEALFQARTDRPVAAAGDRYVLVLSRIHAKKGLETLVEAFLDATSGDDLDRWRLVLAGDGDAAYVAPLRRRAAASGAGSRVVWTGWLDGAERLAALRGADLLALPSRQENFALSAVEAMACGVSVLVSDQVDLAGVVADANAGWVASLDRGDLARALRAALRDPDERRRRGEAGRRVASASFRWPAIAEALAALYARLARGGVAAQPALP